MLELLTALLIMGIIAAMALPMAVNAVKAYKLHADATAVASFLNVARMKAASQYAPYRMNFDTTQGTFLIEKLCGNTPSSGSSGDTNCDPSTKRYNPFTTPKYDLSGTQYIGTGNSLSSCRPSSGITKFPLATITSDPSPCPTTASFYFNTRGMPVDSTGDPLSFTAGGYVIYLTNNKGLNDAVTVSIGGRVATWNWSTGSSTWIMR
jgi:Tfp pilus assembly protein FimT